MSEQVEKRCTGPCGRLLPATFEFFNRAKDGKYGLQACCRDCQKVKSKERYQSPEYKQKKQVYYQAHKEEKSAKDKIRRQINAKEISESRKKRYQQNREKILEQKKVYYQEKSELIWIRRRRPEVRAREKAWGKEYRSRPEIQEHWRAYDKERRSRPEVQERNQAYRRRHDVIERQRAKEKAWRQIPENRERKRMQVKDRYRNNHEWRERELARHKAYKSRPEIQEHRRVYRNTPKVRERMRGHYRRYRINHRERMSAKNKAYRRRPEVREHLRVYGHVRRARERSVSGVHTVAQIRDMLQRHRYHCYYCHVKLRRDRKKAYGYDFHIEHTFPLSRVQGTDIPANDISYLVPACSTCNERKHDKFPWEWPEGGRLF